MRDITVPLATDGMVVDTAATMARDRGFTALFRVEPNPLAAASDKPVVTMLATRGRGEGVEGGADADEDEDGGVEDARLLLVCSEDSKCRLTLATAALRQATSLNAQQLVLIYSAEKTAITPSAADLFRLASTTRGIRAQAFFSLELARPYVYHEDVPMHRLATPAILTRHRVSRSELGTMSVEDPVARWYNFCVDDIVVVFRSGLGTTAPSVRLDRIVPPL